MKLRVLASAAASVLVVGALAGCQFVTPQQTSRSYTPSDGVNASVGADVRVRNVFLVTDDGTDASMIGAISNVGDADRTVTLQYSTDTGDETTQVTVPAGGLLSLRTDAATQSTTSVPTQAQSVVLQGLQAPIGGLFSVGFSTSGTQPVTLRLPVLNGSLNDYQALVPTPTPSSGATETPGASETPATTETPATSG